MVQVQRPDTTLLRGGYDLVSPRVAAEAGALLVSNNYEPNERGYHRTDGYERFSGRVKPSDATYLILDFTSGSAAIVAGATMAGGLSGAQAKAVANAVLESGTYGAGNAAGYVAIAITNGVNFQALEAVIVSAVDVATTSAIPSSNIAPTDAEHVAYTQAEIARRRALITAIPGSGPVRGVQTYKGTVYAFRDDAGATTGTMWKSSTAGWVQVPFTETIAFTLGTAAFLVGETLTRAGVTSVIRRVVLQSGAWSGTAAGYLVVSGRAGGAYTAGIGTSASGSATLSGASVAITLPAGGHYRFKVHNFYGTSGTERLYGVNGVGNGFEFDGTYLVPIKVPGMTSDTPSHIAVKSEHLFLGYGPSGTLLNSEIGEPLQYSAVGGAGEHGFGSPLTELIDDAQTALVVGGRGKVGYLTGTDVDTFDLKIITDDAGMKEFSAAQAVRPTYVDDRGIRNLTATPDFGDWLAGTVSEKVAPLFDAKGRAGAEPIGALRVRRKDQYRLFLSDRTGLFCYIGRKTAEIAPFAIGFTLTCCCSGEDASGNEMLLAGDSAGMVYELDRGTSYDGTEIEAYARLQFNDCGAAALDKRFHSIAVGVDAPGPLTLAIGAEFDDASGEHSAKAERAFSIAGGGAFWGQANWGEFFWSAPVNGRFYARLDGGGQNVSPVFYSKTAIDLPHTLTDQQVNWSPRRVRRMGT